jgi:hypothetical protein
MRNDRKSHHPAFWMLIVAIVAQLGLLGLSMPLSAVLSDGWFFHIDNPLHIYQLELGRTLQAQAIWNGYDPYFGAGSFGGLSSNVSARLTLLVAALLPSSIPAHNVYAIYVLLCSLSAPAAVWTLGRLLQWTGVQQCLGATVGLLMWWIGVFHWYHTAGMVSFVAACYTALPYGVWAFHLCDPHQPLKAGRLVAAGLLGGIGMWLHPLFCIPSTLLILGLVLQNKAYRSPMPLIARATAIGATVVIIALPWIVSLITHRPDVSDSHGYQRSVGLHVLVDSLGINTGAAAGSWLNLLALVGGVAGLWIRRAKTATATAPLLPVGLVLLLFAGFGGLSNTLSFVQPNRFIGPAYLMIGLAASRDLAPSAWQILFNAPGWHRLAVTTFAGLLVLATGRELLREVTPGKHGHHGKSPPEISAPPEVVSKIEAWINANTRPDGRILFETSLGRVHGGGHVAGYLAARTRREFMGGAYPYFLPKSSCWDGHCFDRAIEEVTPELFQSVLAAYNTHWIIAHSTGLKKLAESVTGIRRAAEFDGIVIYTLDTATGFVMHGNGRLIGRNFNRVDIGDVSGSEITLRYQWVPGMQTIPASQIEPYQWSVDFPPFVRVISPPEKFSLKLTK